ncbi:unnamed protein product, partial [Rangifer tarandus platyrhynchus]
GASAMPCPCARRRRRAAPRSPASPPPPLSPPGRPATRLAPPRGGGGGGSRAPGAPQGASLAGRLGSATPRSPSRRAGRRPPAPSPHLAGRGRGRSDVRFPVRRCPDPSARGRRR